MENKVTGNYLIGLTCAALFIAVGYEIKCAYRRVKKEERARQRYLDDQAIRLKQMFNIKD